MRNNSIYCTCGCPKGITSDTESSEWGYWDICCNCGKRLEDGFYYYNHFDGEGYDDIDVD